jgi:hypothetical protein
VGSDNRLEDIKGFRCRVSGFSVAAGFQSDQSDRRRNLMFHMSAAAGQKNGQINRNRNFWGSVPKSAVVGFRISQ